MPEFSVIDQNGNTVSSKDLIGKKTIIYFYPKDNTSGCTAQACNLRDNWQALVAAGYNVVGVSKDSAASHVKFNLGGAQSLGIWAKPAAPYVCIEPWCGVNDDTNKVADFSEKCAIQKVNADDVFNFTWEAVFSE